MEANAAQAGGQRHEAAKELLFKMPKPSPTKSILLPTLRGFNTTLENARASKSPWASAETQAHLVQNTAKAKLETSSTASVRVFSMATKEHFSLHKFVAVVLLCLVGLVVACMFMDEEPLNEETTSQAKQHEDLKLVEHGDGSWARTYLAAESERKQGLELLYRCNIIPAEEFENSKVNQDHIEECIWIARNMLQQRSLDDWCKVWPEAKKRFDDSVTKCFQERTDVRVKSYQNLDRSGDGSSQAEQRPPAKGGTKVPPSASATRDPKGEMPPIIKSDKDRKSLMDRCRQIMAASDAGRRPWQSTGSASASDSSPSPQRPPTFSSAPARTFTSKAASSVPNQAPPGSTASMPDQRR